MNDWQNWRKQQRAELIAQRMQISSSDRILWNQAITHFLIQGFPILQQHIVGFYSAYKGEYDPMPVMEHLNVCGTILALPEVIEPGQPLIYRKWWPKVSIKKDRYGLSVPCNTEVVLISAVMIPMVGFDDQGYRLGYGSGYFDRTLAAMPTHPLTIGIAFEQQRIATTYPQSHDIPMDFIVTERSIYALNQRLHPLSIENCARVSTQSQS